MFLPAAVKVAWFSMPYVQWPVGLYDVVEAISLLSFFAVDDGTVAGW